MSKALDVAAAIKTLVQDALPGADVLGLDGRDAAPDRIGPLGRVIVRAGDPGDPEIDLSPITYNYDHTFELEIAAYQSSSRTAAQAVDDMLGAVATAIQANRTLGGLVDWLDAASPLTDDDYSEGAPVARRADATIVATYSTTRPL